MQNLNAEVKTGFLNDPKLAQGWRELLEKHRETLQQYGLLEMAVKLSKEGPESS